MKIDETHIEAILNLSRLFLEQGQVKKAKDLEEGILVIREFARHQRAPSPCPLPRVGEGKQFEEVRFNGFN